MLKITSSDNPRIKEVVRLKERRARNASGLTIIDGVREVSRALDVGVEFKEVYLCPEFFASRGNTELIDRLEGKKINVVEVSKEIFSKIAFGDRREGVVAVCQPKYVHLSQLKPSAKPFYVILDSVEKPGNLGAILRTCDGAGVDALLLSELKTDIFNPNVIRASMGAVFSVPVVQAMREQILQFLRENKIKIMATSPAGQKIYANANLREPLAIVMGSEQQGLDDFWMKNADVLLRVPMHGRADSLNVSITTAIIVYEALRQRGETKTRPASVTPPKTKDKT